VRLDSFAVLVLRSLAVSFAAVGLVFLLAPDATLSFLDSAGALFGRFDPTPKTGARLWLALAVAYMLLVTLLAWLAQRDLSKARPYLGLLFAGKAASSLLALAAYASVSTSFPYLANFIVDGAIALVVAWLFVSAPGLAASRVSAAGRVRRARERALSMREASRLDSVLEALAPAGEALDPKTAGPSVAPAVIGYTRAAGGLGALRALLLALELSPFVLPPVWFRRFSKLPLEDRVRVIEAWESSRFWPRRQAMAALKLAVLPHVFGQPEVLRALHYPDPLERVPLATTSEGRS
jgi:hypothetical protein